ncbi:MAG TPA: thioredoxin [bacterium]|jgi:putative thioredoxin|nr:thioredoxin [Candidatus Omnitrophota bacterium]HOJ59256.1 thioredoxin [bacterium]HOL96749.1 thioredoxin [bacterium]HPP02092.1 thioredoxin [bacterium]HXK95208.1 thioredoxin [bacterium]
MSPANSFVSDVTADNFEEIVLQAPPDTVVLVDFWAPWCAPCRQLGPVLENIAVSYKGSVRVAKVNVDENPDLSEAFGIQGIPAVKIFRDGELISQFTGAAPEAEIRRLLSRFVSPAADEGVELGRAYLRAGNYDKARQCFLKILESDPANTAARLELARVALRQNDLEAAREQAGAVEPGTSDYEEAQKILHRVEFLTECQGFGDKNDLLRQVQADEDNLDARYRLALCLAAGEEYPQALEELIRVLQKNKNYQDGAAKNAMLKIFTLVGSRSPLANEYREKLSWILF